jgi:6,7-dimethyl-8-ribityllumazine synthase
MTSARNPHIMIAVAPYYRAITDQLLAGAAAEVERSGATHEVFEVGGAFELPVAVRIAHGTGRFDGYVTLGCVIRGETSHYDLICAETARGIQSLAVEHGLAIGFGVLTCENGDQARARADVSGKNKGAEAARACLATLALKAALAGAAR